MLYINVGQRPPPGTKLCTRCKALFLGQEVKYCSRCSTENAAFSEVIFAKERGISLRVHQEYECARGHPNFEELRKLLREPAVQSQELDEMYTFCSDCGKRILPIMGN